jgi:small-conductance mechanosensitive channel
MDMTDKVKSDNRQSINKRMWPLFFKRFSYIISTLIFTLFFCSIIISTTLTSAEIIDVATVNGYVWDQATDSPAENFLVEIDGEYFLGNSTTTNTTGFYELNIPSGTFILRVYDNNNKVYQTLNFTIKSGETKRFDLKINTSAEEPKEEEEDEFEWLNPDQIFSDIVDNWWALIPLLILLILTPILLTYIDRISENIDHRKYKLLDEKGAEFIERIIKYNVYIAFVILLILFLAWLIPGIDRTVWQEVSPHIPAIYLIIILMIIMRLLLLILNTGMEYLRGNLSFKPKIVLSPKYIGILEIILKYVIILIFSLNIIVITLAIFGMGGIISRSFSNFFSDNSGFIVFIIFVLVIMYLTTRFLGTFIGDMKRKETAKISPQIAETIGKLGKFLIYIFGAMVIIFALLQMAGMGDLGETLILMVSIIIGFVVAMAATGSIGNILSGFMLNAFRPYEIGDRVKIGDTIGDVVFTNLAFVRLRTLDNELVDIPNNNVIADKIVNFTKSGSFALNVDVGIGYRVPNTLISKLLIEAARETKDIDDDPRPYVLLLQLGDYAITYRLRAYTTNTKAMVRTKSNLMANVHNQFYSHGIEILSPWYLVQRQEQIPSSKQISDAWEDTDKESREVIEKEVGKKITGGFELMDKTITTDKPNGNLAKK